MDMGTIVLMFGTLFTAIFITISISAFVLYGARR